MFVSSYSTYINTNTSEKTDKLRVENKKDESKSFGPEVSKNSPLEAYSAKNLPIDYVSNYKSFNNQQKLQEQVKSQDELKSKKTTAMKNAKIAYEDNSKIFSLLKKPTTTLNQTKRIDKKLPLNIQEIKESNLRHTMVNTYLENDKYYQITA